MLYKNRFIISVYDEYDQLISVLDNAKDFAFMFDKSIDQAHTILSRLFHKKTTSFYHNSKQLFIAFIED